MGCPNILPCREIGHPHQCAGMRSLQFTIGGDAHNLAACGPWNRHIFKIGLRMARQNHERGELVGIDEQRHTLDAFALGLG